MILKYAVEILLLFVCLCFGFITLFTDKRNIKLRKWENIEKKIQKQKINDIIGEKLSFVDKFRLNAEEVLKLSNSRMTYRQFRMLTILSCLCGMAFGIAVNNIFLVFILGGAFLGLPMLIFSIKKTSYIARLNENLQSAMSIVTNSYLQNEDIVMSVKENLGNIEEPINTMFREFVASNSFIDSNIAKNLRILKAKVDNYQFKEWCDTLILCQEDRELKYVLPAIIDQMSDLKIMQEELATSMANIWREYFMVAGIVLGSIPLLRVLNKDWYYNLTHTLIGQIIVAVVVLVAAISCFAVFKINQPIKEI
ncbi:MAG: hypothetical protein PUF72_05620 [Clostridiales bacterium]|nr:hypothetical protein [Clostridiales bacterium]